MQSDDRSGLGKHEILAQSHADLVPGKPGQHDGAQPFAGAETERQRQNARGAGRPDEARQGESDRGKNRERGRQAEHAQRQRPGEPVRFDQKSRAQPPEARDEVAEAPPPADAESRAERGPARLAAEAPIGRAVDEPDRRHHGNQQSRREAERRHRQGSHGAGRKADESARPAPRQDDAATQGAKGVHRRWSCRNRRGQGRNSRAGESTPASITRLPLPKERVSGTAASLPFRPASAPPGARRPNVDES